MIAHLLLKRITFSIYISPAPTQVFNTGINHIYDWKLCRNLSACKEN